MFTVEPGASPPGSTDAQRGRLAMPARGRGLQGYLFALPALALLAVFLVYPMIQTIRLSLDTGRGFQLREFVGLDNYVRLLTKDRLFLDLSKTPPTGAVFNNILWLFLFVGLCVGFGLLIAVLADRVRYESIIKSIVFLPQAISATAIGVIWLLVYAPSPQVGLVNAGLSALGFDPISWMGRRDTVNFAIIIAAVWAGTGLAVVVFSAAIKGIPAEIVDAARVDGAGPWTTFRHITLPMISLPVSVVTITLSIAVIKVFDIVYIMSRGGPAGASRVIAYTFYEETFEAGKAGYGAAVAVLMVLLVVPIVALNLRRFRAEAVIR
jgi:alpha-glucoside transport system permease protein